MKNILLPIDFYDHPQKALKEILSFLESTEENFKLFLLHTYLVPFSSSNEVIRTHDELHRQSLEKLQKELRVAKQAAPNGKVSFEALSQMGSLPNVIARIIKERKIDCVVVGMKHGFKPDEMTRLLNQIDCPVVILPSSF